MANDAGVPTLANMVMMGHVLQHNPELTFEGTEVTVQKLVPPKKAELVGLNMKALEAGRDYARANAYEESPASRWTCAWGTWSTTSPTPRTWSAPPWSGTGPDVVVLPETWNTGFFPKDLTPAPTGTGSGPSSSSPPGPGAGRQHRGRQRGQPEGRRLLQHRLCL